MKTEYVHDLTGKKGYEGFGKMVCFHELTKPSWRTIFIEILDDLCPIALNVPFPILDQMTNLVPSEAPSLLLVDCIHGEDHLSLEHPKNHALWIGFSGPMIEEEGQTEGSLDWMCDEAYNMIERLQWLQTNREFLAAVNIYSVLDVLIADCNLRVKRML